MATLSAFLVSGQGKQSSAIYYGKQFIESDRAMMETVKHV